MNYMPTVQLIQGQMVLLNHHLWKVILNVLTADLGIPWLKTSGAIKYLFTMISITKQIEFKSGFHHHTW